MEEVRKKAKGVINKVEEVIKEVKKVVEIMKEVRKKVVKILVEKVEDSGGS